MFEKYLVTAKQLARFRSGPLAEERHHYMEHLEHEGRSRGRLQMINSRLLAIACTIDPSSQHLYSSDELKTISEAWLSGLQFKGKNDHRAHIAKTEFHFIASAWLGFLGRLTPPVDDKPTRLRSAFLLPISTVN